jgi:hypothetical protein
MISPEFPQEVPTRVPERTLREFAALWLVFLGGLCALSFYRHQHAPSLAAWVAGALSLLVGVPGLIRPNAIRPVYLGALALTKPIGHALGLILLVVFYYGVVTPLALLFRLAGRDILGRHRIRADSYWVDRLPSRDVRLYLRQYQHQVADPVPSSAPAPTKPAPMQSVRPAIIADPSSSPTPVFPGAKHGSA